MFENFFREELAGINGTKYQDQFLQQVQTQWNMYGNLIGKPTVIIVTLFLGWLLIDYWLTVDLLVAKLIH